MSICDTILPTIQRTQCIGNSLDTINENFGVLKTAACDNYNTIDALQTSINSLNTKIESLSSQTPGFAKAWVKFDGTRDSDGNTSTDATDRFLYSSYNIRSVLKKTSFKNTTTESPVSAGDYRIYFTNEFADENYAVIGTSIEASIGTSYGWLQPYNLSEQFVDVRVHSPTLPFTEAIDPSQVSVAIF